MSLTVNPEQAPPCSSTLLTTLSFSKGGRSVEWVDKAIRRVGDEKASSSGQLPSRRKASRFSDRACALGAPDRLQAGVGIEPVEDLLNVVVDGRPADM